MNREIIIDETTNTKTTTTQHDNGSASMTIEMNPDEFKSKPELLRKITKLDDKNFELWNKLESANYRLMVLVTVNIVVLLGIAWNYAL